MEKDLNKLRKQIDEIDTNLLKLIRERLDVVSEVAKYKKGAKKQIRDYDREKEVIKNKLEIAKKLNIDEGFTHDLFELIMDNSREYQKELLEND